MIKTLKRRRHSATAPADAEDVTVYAEGLCVGYGAVPVLRDVSIGCRRSSPPRLVSR
jgi:hypothetical protein